MILRRETRKSNGKKDYETSAGAAPGSSDVHIELHERIGGGRTCSPRAFRRTCRSAGGGTGNRGSGSGNTSHQKDRRDRRERGNRRGRRACSRIWTERPRARLYRSGPAFYAGNGLCDGQHRKRFRCGRLQEQPETAAEERRAGDQHRDRISA